MNSQLYSEKQMIYTLSVKSKVYNWLHAHTESESQRYRKIEITPCILSDHHRDRLDFNNRNTKKPPNSWELNRSLLNENWAQINREIKDFLEINENEHTYSMPKLMGYNECSVKKKVHSTTCLCKKKKKMERFYTNNSTASLKTLEP